MVPRLYSLGGAALLALRTDHVIAAFQDGVTLYEVNKGTMRLPLSKPVLVTETERIAKFRAKSASAEKAKAAAPKKRHVPRYGAGSPHELFIRFVRSPRAGTD